MISLQTIGSYKLVQTKKRHTKVLHLGDSAYAWIDFENIGEILVTARSDHSVECDLSVGEYRIYDVESEPQLNDNVHLELQVGRNRWQGYLLLSGLPDKHRTRTRLIPTSEIITDNPQFKEKIDLLPTPEETRKITIR